MNKTLIKLALVSAFALVINNAQANDQDIVIQTVDPITGEVIYGHCPAVPDCPLSVLLPAANLEEDN